MNFSHSDKVRGLQQRVSAFMETFVYPAERRFEDEVAKNRRAGNPWLATEVVEELKARGARRGLWNLFLPETSRRRVTNLEYAPLCEIMGRSPMGPEVFNCSAPDTGNMEVLARYGTPEQQQRWLNRCWRANSFVLRHDRTRRGFLRRHEHPSASSATATNT